MYCRLATATPEGEQHHDFDPEFDLVAVIDKLSTLRGCSAAILDEEPLSYTQAVKGPYAKQWITAMDTEIASFTRMSTWKLVKRPRNIVLSGKWVYKIKRKADGSELFKARWVVRGFEQQYGVNFDETYSSVVKSSSFKTMFAMMAHHDLECEQMDVVTAFLNAPLHETVFVEQPTGYEQAGGLVCLLLRALYGLK